MEMSRLENNQFEIFLEPFNLKEAVSNVLEIMEF